MVFCVVKEKIDVGIDENRCLKHSSCVINPRAK